MVADVWKKDVWEFQAKSGSSSSCRLFLHFLGKIAVQEMSGKRLEVPDILLPDIHGLLIYNYCHVEIGRSWIYVLSAMGIWLVCEEGRAINRREREG